MFGQAFGAALSLRRTIRARSVTPAKLHIPINLSDVPRLQNEERTGACGRPLPQGEEAF